MKITIKELADLLKSEDPNRIIDFDILPCGYCIETYDKILKNLEKKL